MIPGSPRPPATLLVLALLALAGCRAAPGEAPGTAATESARPGEGAVAAPDALPTAPPATPTPATPTAATPIATSPAGTGPAAPLPPAGAVPPAADAGPAAAVAGSPEQVLQDWAAAIERRDWAAVRRLWGHAGADSGQDAAAFARRWDRLRHPRVTIGAGDQEGAAGSLYYTADVTLHDGVRRVTQPVTLRRVNDVDGATPEQLRWHLEASTRVRLPG